MGLSCGSIQKTFNFDRLYVMIIYRQVIVHCHAPKRKLRDNNVVVNLAREVFIEKNRYQNVNYYFKQILQYSTCRFMTVVLYLCYAEYCTILYKLTVRSMAAARKTIGNTRHVSYSMYCTKRAGRRWRKEQCCHTLYNVQHGGGTVYCSAQFVPTLEGSQNQ